MHVTRRTLASGLVLSLGLGALGLPVLKRASSPDYAQTLQRELDALAVQLAPGTRLEITGFQVVQALSAGVEMVAHVHMTWAPGERQIPYAARANTAEMAFGKLRDTIVAEVRQLHLPLANRRSGAGTVA
jgi:hypothetical protein